jgi:BirA family transcriptional regulator, biotin operon repressor / biotin---[acetyl-CoA-carboxylase] ligase
MTVSRFVSRLERLDSVPSTQPVVRRWLDMGEREVAVATADEQTAGRGRLERGWIAPPGAALLVSAGFRPVFLEPRHAWRLAATASLAMLDAAEEVAGLRDRTLWLKWPNDIVADAEDGGVRKVAGVLGENQLDPRDDHLATAVIGIGVNADWPAELFPAPIRDGMTSLRECAGGRPIDREALLDAWLARLEPRYEALRQGRFDAGAWSSRQRTTGAWVELVLAGETVEGSGAGVDPESGALLVDGSDGSTRAVTSGEVVRCRIHARRLGDL